MVLTSLGVSAARGTIRRRVADVDDLTGQLRQLVHDGFGQCLLVSRLPLCRSNLFMEDYVDLAQKWRVAGRASREFAFNANLGSAASPWQRVGAWWRPAQASSQSSDRRRRL